jgi:hypothetical protein
MTADTVNANVDISQCFLEGLARTKKIFELSFRNGSTFASPTKTHPAFKACKRAASKLLN